eukprot:30806-Pelagococcus_subviridis.AAC.2
MSGTRLPPGADHRHPRAVRRALQLFDDLRELRVRSRGVDDRRRAPRAVRVREAADASVAVAAAVSRGRRRALRSLSSRVRDRRGLAAFRDGVAPRERGAEQAQRLSRA